MKTDWAASLSHPPVLLFRLFSWRHWVTAPRTTLLLLLILALGVAVFLSIRLASRAAATGFDLFTESVGGGSDFILRPVAGERLPASLLPALRARLDPLPVGIFPMIEANAAEIGAASGPRNFQIVGADWIGLRNAAVFQENPSTLPLAETATGNLPLGREDQAFIGAALADKRGLGVGDTLELAVNDRIATIQVTGILRDDPLRPAVPENLLLLDLPGAQKLLGIPDAISRIDLKIPPGADANRHLEETAARLREAAGTRFLVDTPDTRRETASQMTRAFRMNLTILSTLALLVGTYLILQSLEAAVVRRRREIAILRSLGVTPGAIRRMWLTESLVLGFLGSLIGVFLGVGLAQFTVGGIARTVNALYFATARTAAAPDLWEIGLAILFGMSASLLAGWLPAREASETPPAQALRTGQRSSGIALLQHPGIGLGLLLAAAALAWAPPWTGAGNNRIPVGGYAAAFASLAGLGILAGLLFPPAARILRGKGRSPVRVYAASQIARPTGRHRLAAAGLLVAIGMAAGMGILVHSFENTLTQWIAQILKADLYVAAAGSGNASNTNVIPEPVWKEIAHRPEVEGVDAIRHYPLRFRERDIRLAGADYNERSGRRLDLIWLQKPDDPDPRTMRRTTAEGFVPVWANESFSRRFGLRRGDAVVIPLPHGPETLRIAGVYSDFSDESGTLIVNRRFTANWFSDESVSNLAVYLRSGHDPGDFRAAWMADYPSLIVRTNALLRAEALRVFRQTFSVTYALEAIAVLVAVAGLGMALASLLIERRAEMQTLRSLGMSRSQIATASAWEGVALGLAGTVSGLLLGLILGWLLIYAINRQSFGWTLDFHLPVLGHAALALLTVAASVAVSAAVGYWGSRLRAEQEE